MKQLFTILFFFFGSYFATAQLDNPNGNGKGGKTIGTINAPAAVKEITRPISLDFENENGFKNANNKLQEKRKREQKEREEELSGVITKEIIAKKQFKKNIEGERLKFPMIDMDLGSFHTKSKYMIVASYDFGIFDGDKVSIAINGKRIHNNLLLTRNINTIKIPLEIGINKIEITAIDEGRLSPNTGSFFVFDDQKQTVKDGNWFLAKGAKVVAIVIRDPK